MTVTTKLAATFLTLAALLLTAAWLSPRGGFSAVRSAAVSGEYKAR
jgi:hypothetical protein